MKRKSSAYLKRNKKIIVDAVWEPVNIHAAGVDIGAREHWACVPREASERPVRKFDTFTMSLEAMAEWFKQCGVTTVAMEATGVYWIPLFQILEKRGFTVILANARQTKNVAGRKSDVQDCQWIQRLHTYGLLQGSFRPADNYCVLRSYLRYRDELIGARSTQCQHMQKALHQMNIQLTQVLSDITGTSGFAIIAAILEGERDSAKLAALVDRRVRASQQTITHALKGDYRTEHLFVLRHAFDLYSVFDSKIRDCEQEIARESGSLCDRVDITEKPLPPRKEGAKPQKEILGGLNMREQLYRKLGVDLTAIEGIGIATALAVLTELGPSVERFPSEKHFCSWLGLCPDNRISGGKVLSSRTRRVINRLTDALRMAATALERSQSALGGYFRRMKARLGAAEGITATAHKLARIIYRLLKFGEEYVRLGLEDYEHKFKERRLQGIKKTARSLGFELVATQTPSSAVS